MTSIAKRSSRRWNGCPIPVPTIRSRPHSARAAGSGFVVRAFFDSIATGCRLKWSPNGSTQDLRRTTGRTIRVDRSRRAWTWHWSRTRLLHVAGNSAP